MSESNFGDIISNQPTLRLTGYFPWKSALTVWTVEPFPSSNDHLWGLNVGLKIFFASRAGPWHRVIGLCSKPGGDAVTCNEELKTE